MCCLENFSLPPAVHLVDHAILATGFVQGQSFGPHSLLRLRHLFDIKKCGPLTSKKG